MHTLRSGDSNEAQIYLAFGYYLPKTLLISHVKTVFNHWSGEVGRSGSRLRHIFTCILGEISVWIKKCIDRHSEICTFLKANIPTLRVHWHFYNSLRAVIELHCHYLYRYNPNGPANCRSWSWQKLQHDNLRRRPHFEMEKRNIHRSCPNRS